MTQYLSSPRLSPLLKTTQKEKAKEIRKTSPDAALIHIPLHCVPKEFHRAIFPPQIMRHDCGCRKCSIVSAGFPLPMFTGPLPPTLPVPTAQSHSCKKPHWKRNRENRNSDHLRAGHPGTASLLYYLGVLPGKGPDHCFARMSSDAIYVKSILR
jgi:hypothetical protein